MTRYEQRRQRWLELAQTLPPELRDRIALRNIRNVVSLPERAQQTLARAVSAGLKRQKTAIRHLTQNPDATVEDLLQLGWKSKPHGQDGHIADPPPESMPGIGLQNLAAMNASLEEHQKPEVVELAELLQFCQPGLYDKAARSIAVAEFMDEARDLVRAWQACQRAQYFDTETVIVLYCGFVEKMKAHLDQLLDEKPAYREAVSNSGVDWP